MNIYYILSNDTIDMDLKEVIEEKTAITDAVNKGQNASSNEDQSTDWTLIHKLRSKNRTK